MVNNDPKLVGDLVDIDDNDTKVASVFNNRQT